MKRLKKYEHTIYASYLGYITQAICNNFAPLLFLTFSGEFHLTLDKITLITTINYLVQLIVDFVSVKYIDRIGYRISIIAAHVFAAAGLIGLAVLPGIFTNLYIGIFWPGTFSLAALKLPTAGTAMYAFMALAGDVGCSAGPTLVGFAANANQNNLQTGLLMALVFPVMILVGMWLLREKR